MRIKLLLALISCMGMAGCVGHRSFKAMCGIPEDTEEYSCWAGDVLPGMMGDDTDGNLDGMEFDMGDPCYSLESCQPEFMRGFPIQYPENK